MFMWRQLREWYDALSNRIGRRAERRQAVEYEHARNDFHHQREWLEVKFIERASTSGKPRGLRWTDVEFDNDVTYAREISTRELCAFVAITVSFEAIEGGPMEDVEAVSRKRAATAVFRLIKGAWTTQGRALFNLTPIDAIEHFREELELVGRETTVTS